MNTIFNIDKLTTSSTFSLAISRDMSGTGFGGYLTIGGIPDITNSLINASSTFTSAPWQPDPNFVSFTYTSYLISVSAVSWTGGSDATSRLYVVDSGTISIWLPDADAAAINAQFNPPARYSNGYYFVECEATPPALSFTINDREFPISPLDMIWYDVESSKTCKSAVQNGGTTNILGDPFFRSVLAVFDWGTQQMHLSPRTYYDS